MEIENHERVIVHIDIDCFYAQVEMNKRPELRNVPLGVQQKNIVVTCNYPARARGVGKCSYIQQAKEACPELVLVNGEDLAEYRRVSTAVYSSLCETGCPVERLGMDENWVDVSQMVKLRERERRTSGAVDSPQVQGHIFGDLTCDNCDCVDRLKIGSIIAKELRNVLLEKHQLTCSAGIAHNKLLSKLAGNKYKPNDQTVVGGEGVSALMDTLKSVTAIPGIGRRTGEQLAAANITTLEQLRTASVETLVGAGILRGQAEVIRGLAWGSDTSEVKMSGRPASVGLEDRFMGLYDVSGCREKLQWLLGRLTGLLAEDGRKPTSIKVTARDKEKDAKKFHKESRQCRISPRLFTIENGGLKPEATEEILEICLGLLAKIIDFSGAFHLTLLGLAVTDFLDQVERKSSIKNFFISPKKDGIPQSIPTGQVKPKNVFGTSSDSSKPSTSSARKTMSTSVSASTVTKTSGSNLFKSETKPPNASLLDSWIQVPGGKRSKPEERLVGQGKRPKSAENVSGINVKDEDEAIAEPPVKIDHCPKSVDDTSVNENCRNTVDNPAEKNDCPVSVDPDLNHNNPPVGSGGGGGSSSSADLLTCPPYYDKEVWAGLPTDLQLDLLRSIRAPTASSAEGGGSSSTAPKLAHALSAKVSKKNSRCGGLAGQNSRGGGLAGQKKGRKSGGGKDTTATENSILKYFSKS